ncbi:MAG: endonuclease/exonuclease/phosphatase family protein [Planctomycetota bacterium]
MPLLPEITDDLEPAAVAGCDEVVCWNVLHGGGPSRMPEIALELLRLRPHTVVLLEWRPSVGGQIAGVLADHGLEHQLSTNPPPRTNGILIASRSPLLPEAPPRSRRGALVPGHRWLGAHAPELGLSLAAVHVPCSGSSQDTRGFWRAIETLGVAGRRHPLLLVGDFNTDRSRASGVERRGRHALGRLATLGFVDAWRNTHPAGHDATWSGAHFGRETQGRIDQAWVSPALAPRLRGARHIHRARRLRISDHSAVGVSIAPKPRFFWGPGLYHSQKTLEKQG